MKTKLFSAITSRAVSVLRIGGLFFIGAFTVGVMFGMARMGWLAAKALFGF